MTLAFWVWVSLACLGLGVIVVAAGALVAAYLAPDPRFFECETDWHEVEYDAVNAVAISKARVIPGDRVAA